jgi:hypothetical protein
MMPAALKLHRRSAQSATSGPNFARNLGLTSYLEEANSPKNGRIDSNDREISNDSCFIIMAKI